MFLYFFKSKTFRKIKKHPDVWTLECFGKAFLIKKKRKNGGMSQLKNKNRHVPKINGRGALSTLLFCL